MSRSKAWGMLGMLIAIAMIVAACQPAPAPTPETIVQTVIVEGTPQVIEVVATAEPAEVEEEPAGPKVLKLAWGPSDVPTIDSALAWDVISIQLIDEMTIGLTRQNEETAELELAMATDYSVSEDGLTYTFTIRDGVPWVRYNGNEVEQVLDCEGNPRMVTAYDFEYGLMRTANPDTAADYAYLLSMTVDGAEPYINGDVDDPSTMGVRAVDERTLEIKFLRPAVYNLNIAGLWFAHAMPEWIIDGDECTEGRGQKWIETGFYQGYGPFTLKEWVHDAELSMIKNPFWPGDDVVPTPKLDEVHYTIIDVSPALAEYEAGNLHTSGIPSGDFDRVTTDPVLSQQITQTFSLGTEFYSFNTQLEPTDDVRVRQALSMSIDTQGIMDSITKTGLVAHWQTHPGAAGAPKPDLYPELGIYYDPEAAKALIDEYAAEKGISPNEINIVLMYNTAETNKKRAEAVQQMWQDTLGISVQLTNQEWQVYRQARIEGNEHVYRSSWVQDYPDANNFLTEVFGPTGAYHDVVDWPVEDMSQAYENEAFDRFVSLLEQAAVEEDPDARMELYAQAEQILVVEEAVIVPLHWYASQVLTRPEVIRTQSLTGYDRFEKWDLAD